MEGMRFDEGRLLPTGVLQEVNPTRQMHQRETGHADYEFHLKAQTHYWVVLITHRATDGILDSHDGVTGDLPLLDADTMAGPPLVGCHICEQPYEPRLRRRKCPGEPR